MEDLNGQYTKDEEPSSKNYQNKKIATYEKELRNCCLETILKQKQEYVDQRLIEHLAVAILRAVYTHNFDCFPKENKARITMQKMDKTDIICSMLYRIIELSSITKSTSTTKTAKEVLEITKLLNEKSITTMIQTTIKNPSVLISISKTYIKTIVDKEYLESLLNNQYYQSVNSKIEELTTTHNILKQTTTKPKKYSKTMEYSQSKLKH